MKEVATQTFEKFCVLYAHYYALSEAETFLGLSESLRMMFAEMEYKAVVKPLICRDRHELELSWEFLSRRYCLPQATVRRLAGCCAERKPVIIDREKPS